MGFVWFYILQAREISRFYQQRSAVKKESQVSNVLNSQTDGIIIVEKMQTEHQNNDEEIEFSEPKLNFEFCNSMSIKMFGIDFTWAKRVERQDLVMQ